MQIINRSFNGFRFRNILIILRYFVFRTLNGLKIDLFNRRKTNNTNYLVEKENKV
jgi:hypothetical protein